jgi:flagellar protein FlaG
MSITSIASGGSAAQPSLKPADNASPPAQPAAVSQAPAATATSTARPPTPAQEVQRAVAILNQLIEPVTSSVSFKIDDSTGKTVIRVMDTDTNTLIRQFPTEEALALTRVLDAHQGRILNTQA